MATDDEVQQKTEEAKKEFLKTLRALCESCIAYCAAKKIKGDSDYFSNKIFAAQQAALAIQEQIKAAVQAELVLDDISAQYYALKKLETRINESTTEVVNVSSDEKAKLKKFDKQLRRVAGVGAGMLMVGGMVGVGTLIFGTIVTLAFPFAALPVILAGAGLAVAGLAVLSAALLINKVSRVEKKRAEIKCIEAKDAFLDSFNKFEAAVEGNTLAVIIEKEKNREEALKRLRDFKEICVEYFKSKKSKEAAQEIQAAQDASAYVLAIEKKISEIRNKHYQQSSQPMEDVLNFLKEEGIRNLLLNFNRQETTLAEGAEGRENQISDLQTKINTYERRQRIGSGVSGAVLVVGLVLIIIGAVLISVGVAATAAAAAALIVSMMIGALMSFFGAVGLFSLSNAYTGSNEKKELAQIEAGEIFVKKFTAFKSVYEPTQAPNIQPDAAAAGAEELNRRASPVVDAAGVTPTPIADQTQQQPAPGMAAAAGTVGHFKTLPAPADQPDDQQPLLAQSPTTPDRSTAQRPR